MKIEVWTHTPEGYRQRVYGSADTALAAARVSLEDHKTIQIRLNPEPERRIWNDDAP